tara:strand:- start:138 stop:242 length:105 start_codon:yes stop_codon:yes gene_type:complete
MEMMIKKDKKDEKERFLLRNNINIETLDYIYKIK